MQKVENLKLRLLSYGPRARISIDGMDMDVDPDLLIALEGIGTFEGISLEERLRSIILDRKDPKVVARKAHKESTRRGHASLSTSVFVQFEVRDCSRIGSMILVASKFGSYLQESQRRKKVDRSYMLYPSEIEGSKSMYEYENAMNSCIDAYERFCAEGVSIEDARYVLPLGIRTSVFVSTTLEGLIPLLMLGREKLNDVVPYEIEILANRILEMLSNVAPMILDARTSFKGDLAYYPIPNPFKHDDAITKIAERNGYPSSPKILEVNVTDPILLSEDVKKSYEVLSHSIRVSVLEPMSLVAYHQAIRHRTVPTVPESIYSALERAISNIDVWVKIPPSISASLELKEHFIKTVRICLDAYRSMVANGVKRSTAIYIVPQSIVIYALRFYDGFNLLSPIGFIATRTCSMSQHEERSIAYSIWKGIERLMPMLAEKMGEKCKHLGYCPERDWCSIILKYRNYSNELHRMMMV